MEEAARDPSIQFRHAPNQAVATKTALAFLFDLCLGWWLRWTLAWQPLSPLRWRIDRAGRRLAVWYARSGVRRCRGLGSRPDSQPSQGGNSWSFHCDAAPGRNDAGHPRRDCVGWRLLGVSEERRDHRYDGLASADGSNRGDQGAPLPSHFLTHRHGQETRGRRQQHSSK